MPLSRALEPGRARGNSGREDGAGAAVRRGVSGWAIAGYYDIIGSRQAMTKEVSYSYVARSGHTRCARHVETGSLTTC